MFVERSAARMRLARVVFVTACLIPALGLLGWAAYRRTPRHMATLLDGWTKALGVGVSAASVEHVRPSVVRLHDVALAAPNGGPLLTMATTEVEFRPDAPLVRVPQVELDMASIGACFSLAKAWLAEPVRFRQGVVIDIGRFVWRIGDTRIDAGGLHLECVVAERRRAVRIRREPADGDELRLRWEPTAAEPRLTVDLVCQQALPAAVVAAASGWMLPLGEQATVRGQCSATHEGGRWHGEGSGRVEQVDLAKVAAAIDQQAEGRGELLIEKVIIDDDRIAEAQVALMSDGGRVGRRLIERMVTLLGCQPGSVLPSLQEPAPDSADGTVRFDQLQLAIDVGSQGMVLMAEDRVDSTLITAGGRPLLMAGGLAVPVERLAWLFVPADATVSPAMIPASPRAMQVLSYLPLSRGPSNARY